MSKRSERSESEGVSVLDQFRSYYHVPVLAALIAFMLWVRARDWQNFVTENGTVLFSGNDAWYHYRAVSYTVRNWPSTIYFDPWSYFPYGTELGQFGTLYDQLVATAALVVGLGSPSQHEIAMTLLFTPVVFGALTAIPMFYIGRHFGGRLGGLVAVTLLALTPGGFLFRSVVGFSDHHIAEAFFMAVAIVAVLASVRVAQEEKPVLELAIAREFDALRRPLSYAVLAGVAISLYTWVWPPGIFVVGILAVFYGVGTLVGYMRGRSPDFLGLPAIVTFLTVFLLTLVQLDTMELSATSFSPIHPLLALVAALGMGTIVLGARALEERDLPETYLPAGIVGAGLLLTAVVAVATPDVFAFIVRQVTRVFGLSANQRALTVAEATPVPLRNAGTFLFQSYGLAYLTALIGFGVALYRYVTHDDQQGEALFLIVLMVFLTLATFTQRRFDYYLALPVAALNAVFVSWVVTLVDLDDLDDVTDIAGYQVMAIAAVFLLITAPLAASGAVMQNSRSGPGSVQQWDSTLHWMNESTPALGAYDTGDEQSMDYYGPFQKTEDYEYQSGEYGTLAWWDYGHWITTIGHRVPTANPFQQGARDAADVLLAPSEQQAFENLPNEGAGTPYVIIDYQLGVAGTRKFSAPATWEQDYNLSSGDISRTIYNEEFQRQATLHTPRSYQSLRVRLYQFHGSAASPQQVPGSVFVFDWREQPVELRDGSTRTFSFVPEDGQLIKRFPNMTAAREYTRQDPSSQVGGFPGFPTEEIPALQHYRLVYASPETGNQQGYSWTKVFERVEGAEVQGTAPAGQNVTATVEMRIPTTNTTFTYVQRATANENGEFTMTLPYSTTGYENFGPENGHTNVSVRATGPYRFTTPQETNESTLITTQAVATANVTEAQVLGEDDTVVTVDLQEQVTDAPEGAGNTTASVAPEPVAIRAD
ncbi:oligosaccharyl transferase, archaeosortase A system-associated [Natronomonas sp. EA1]|uniref:oligosaccharyl transferase, archaeosortase A system-associated n=1 Tax=Natronomonas sp. EA1 TaxID=3421655 RepID=UPI003EB98890